MCLRETAGKNKHLAHQLYFQAVTSFCGNWPRSLGFSCTTEVPRCHQRGKTDVKEKEVSRFFLPFPLGLSGHLVM